MNVIRITGVPGMVMSVDTIANVGNWVKEFDPDAHDGRGHLVSTPDLAEAMLFPDALQAWEFWRQQSRVLPFRSDGEPNRPLTAFTVTIEPVPL